MNGTLRDQLLKAGLVTESKVRQASQEDEQRRRQRKGEGKARAEMPRAPSAAQQAAAQKAARDLELNRKQQEKAQRKALRAQINQMIEQACLPRLTSDEYEYFNFVDAGKIHRVAVDAQRREGICGGKLAIVRYKGHHAVVPLEAAERIRERDPQTVVSLDAPSQAAAEDDPYKDFVVPDDLTW